MDEASPVAEGPSLSRRVAAGAAWAQVSRIAEFGSSLALSLILIRALGSGRYGQYSFLVNAAGIGAALLSLGFPDTVMRFVSVLLARDEVPQIRFLMRRLFLARVLVYAAGVAVIFLLRPVADQLQLPLADRYWWAIALLLVSQGAIEFTTSYAYARLRPRDVAIARTLGQVVALAFFGAVVLLGLTDVATASITLALAYLSAAVMLVFRGLGGVLVSGVAAPTPLRPVAGLALGAWTAALFNIGLAGQIDVVLLGALRHDVVQIALYSVATLVFVKLGTLLSGWAGTATSSFADVQTRRGASASRRLLEVYMRVQVVLALLVYPPIILTSRQITTTVFGPGYEAAGRLMEVYGIFWFVSSMLAAGIPLSLLLAIGMQRQASAIRAGTGLLNVVLDVALIPPLGALGAILATGAANAVAHLGDFWVAARRLEAAYPWAFAARMVLAAAVGVLPGLFFADRGLLPATLAALLYLVLFVGAIAVLRPLAREDVELVARLSPRAAELAGRIAAAETRGRPGDGSA